MKIPDDTFFVVKLQLDNKVMIVTSMRLPIVGKKGLMEKHMGRKCDNTEKAIMEAKDWIQDKFNEALSGKVIMKHDQSEQFQVDTKRLKEITFDLLN